MNENYDILQENPWEKNPNFTTYKHKDNKKWFALIMEVPYEKINVDKDGLVEVVNLKNIPEMIGGLRKNDGILPAYHMNKEYWITVLLDGTVEKQTIFNLIDISYDLTKNKKNKEKKTRSIICQIYI
ncbi:MAG: MmcQ/YjbR family DNA-binding protein [Clostridia bacterium]|nr:MmcQ/YjbR family DNA-binding protein [Clostridia bacterium]